MVDPRSPLKSTAAKTAGLLGFLALTSTVAFGLPWDIDMADAQSVKAYEYRMYMPPEGTVHQDNALTPKEFRRSYTLAPSDTALLSNPLEKTDATLEYGEKMYDTYCTPCHGNGQVLGPVSLNYPGIALLAGPGGRLKAVDDGRLYVTIRHGYGLMQSYGYAMNDTEIWSLVHHLRTLPQSQYVPPAPAGEEGPQ